MARIKPAVGYRRCCHQPIIKLRWPQQIGSTTSARASSIVVPNHQLLLTLRKVMIVVMVVRTTGGKDRVMYSNSGSERIW